jgi:hypothetical protein
MVKNQKKKDKDCDSLRQKTSDKLSEAEAIACIRDAVLQVFRPMMTSWSRTERLEAVRVVAIHFPGYVCVSPLLI